MCVEPDGAECWCAGAGLSSGGDASRDEPACRGRGTLKLEVEEDDDRADINETVKPDVRGI